MTELTDIMRHGTQLPWPAPGKCLLCGGPMVKGKRESPAKFAARSYCSAECRMRASPWKRRYDGKEDK